MDNPNTEEDLYVFKVIVAGPSSVGKTCLVQRFVDNRFVKDTKSTIGVDFSLKNVEMEDETRRVALQIWDMAGEKRFHDVLPYYIAGTQGIILAFDSTNEATLDSLGEWIQVIKSILPEKVPMTLISTKHDLDDNRIEKAKLDAFIKENEIDEYQPTSSVSGHNVQLVFMNLTKLITAGKFSK